ncbi:MAG: hypothetical protein LUC93_08305 [Planctomycetaceae bacterium]|nr:hypothetical protein [Planctomycetaceae bacterium]
MSPGNLAYKLIATHFSICLLASLWSAWPSYVRSTEERKHPTWRTQYDIWAINEDEGVFRYVVEVVKRSIDFLKNKYFVGISTALWMGGLFYIDLEEQRHVKSFGEVLAAIVSVLLFYFVLMCGVRYEKEWKKKYTNPKPDHRKERTYKRQLIDACRIGITKGKGTVL